MRSATRKKTGKDKDYLAWLHELPCCVPTCTSKNLHKWPQAEAQTEAAHVGERGLSQKCPDREAIPLCGFHHRTGSHSCHVLGKKFWTLHAMDKQEIIARLNAEYERLHA